MKKLFTRVLAGALGVSMFFSGSVFAVDEDAVKAPSDIDPLAYEAIYSQLKRQDALDMMDVAEYVYRTTNPPKTALFPTVLKMTTLRFTHSMVVTWNTILE